MKKLWISIRVLCSCLFLAVVVSVFFDNGYKLFFMNEPIQWTWPSDEHHEQVDLLKVFSVIHIHSIPNNFGLGSYIKTNHNNKNNIWFYHEVG